MGLLEQHECVSIYWTPDGSVHGVRAAKSKTKLEVAGSTVAHGVKEELFHTASGAISVLTTPSTQLIVAGGNIPGSVCFDLSVPPMNDSDIRQAIHYELPRQVPCNPSEMVFGYRIIRAGSVGEGSKMLLRIFAILKADWNALITELSAAGIRIDAFMHPYQLVDPLLSEQEVFYMPDIDPDFMYSKDADSGIRQMVKMEVKSLDISPSPDTVCKALNFSTPETIAQKDLGRFMPAMILAAYALGPDFADKRNTRVLLPPEIVPERFRMLKMSFFILLAVFVLMLLSLGARHWWDSWSRMQSLLAEKNKVVKQIKEIREQNSRMAELDQAIVKLAESESGISSPAAYLHELSKIIPKDAWVIHVSTRGNAMDISLRASSDKRSAILPSLNNSNLFKAKNSYTRRNSDGSENIYINLDLLPVKDLAIPEDLPAEDAES
ncbi:MAG: hypothetical protein JW808_02705 [Victivallales bacterium]|nr:hypothetical protein [Victivallales bacterium]